MDDKRNKDVHRNLSPPRIPDSPVGRKIRVLVADDHKILRQGIVSLLSDEPDLEVVGQAEDGLEAVALAGRTRPDVILMDITMPRLGGIEATRQITATWPRARVIGLSMHEETGMAAEMRAAGATAYLTKGGSVDLLLHVIRATASTAFGDSRLQ